MPASRRWRLWLEMMLSIASAILGLVTLVWHDWIEIVFGFDPDHHNGAVEWIVVFVLLAAAVLFGIAARRERHRVLTEPNATGSRARFEG